MTPEQIKELIDRLLNSGEILATKGFELALRQVYSYIVLDIVWAIFWAIVCIILVVLAVKLYQQGKEEEESDRYHSEEGVLYTLAVSSGVLALFSFMGIIIQSVNAYLHASNPAWYAVQLLVQTFIK